MTNKNTVLLLCIFSSLLALVAHTPELRSVVVAVLLEYTVKTPAYASIAGAFDCIFSSLLAQKRTSLKRLVQNKFKILTLLLNGTYVNTLYEVLLTEWVDDHERKDSYDSCCIRNCCWVNSTIIRNITINNHTS